MKGNNSWIHVAAIVIPGMVLMSQQSLGIDGGNKEKDDYRSRPGIHDANAVEVYNEVKRAMVWEMDAGSSPA